MAARLLRIALLSILFLGALLPVLSQEQNPLVTELEAAALETAQELTAKINRGWERRETRYIEIAGFDYKGFQVPLGQIWARLLQDTLIETGGSQIKVLSTDGTDRQTPAFRIKGEILDFGSALTIHTDIISYEDMSIAASIRKVIDKTPQIASLLLDDSAAGGTVSPDIFEPDSPSQMAPLSIEQGSIRRSLTSGDEDWFDIQPGDARAVTIYTTGELDTYMSVYRHPGGSLTSPIAENDDWGEDTNSGVTLTIPQDTGIAVKITGYDDATGIYSLHLEASQPIEDALEPNNNAEEATQILLNAAPLSSAFTTNSDTDWFRFTIEDGPLFISAYTAGELDTQMSLYNAAYEDIGYNDDGSTDYNAEIITRLDPGTYFIELTELDGSTGVYSVAVETRDLDFDQYEPDNSILKPRDIRRGETQLHNFIPGNDRDYVTFTLEGTEDVVFYTLGNIDTYLKLFDEDGEMIAEDDDSGTEYNAMITQRLDPGRYYLEVSQVSEDVTSENYRLIFR